VSITVPARVGEDLLPTTAHQALRELAEFVAEHGHTRVPVGHNGHHFDLGTWVCSVRYTYRIGQLRDDVAWAVNAVPGWVW
jgi:hypothetical protein